MALSLNDVRIALLPEEPDYAALKMLGAEALPHLATLVAGTDPGLASKAASLAGMIADAGAADVLLTAARHRDPVVRVAAAAAASHLPPEAVGRVVLPLLRDADVGVRKLALRSLAKAEPGMVAAQLQTLERDEREPALREMITNMRKR